MEHSPPPDAIRRALENVLASSAFRGANRSGSLLRFVVEATLAGRAQQLKEYTLGVDALARGEAFDPRLDPIVRVEMSRLRARLDQYYAKEATADTVRISLPKGSYVPRFSAEDAAPLAAAAEDTEAPPATPRSEPRGPSRWRDAAWLGAGGALAAVFAAWFSLLGRTNDAPPEIERPLQLDVALGAPGQIAAQVGNSVAISPDGRVLAFVALAKDGGTRLFVRRLDELEATELDGGSGAYAPFFSPDGQWIGFWAEGRIKKALAAGAGSPIVLAEATDFLGAGWAEDGTIIATLDKSGSLWRVPQDGGTPKRVASFEPAAQLPRWPQVLPGGEAALVTTTQPSGAAIELVRLDSGERRTVVPTGSYGRYLPSGDLVFVDRGTLFAVPFDPETGATRGAPLPVLRNVAYDSQFGFAQLDIARDGTLVYLRSSAPGTSTLRWLEGAGSSRALVAEPARYLWPRLSADARHLAFVQLDGADPDVWTFDLATGTKTRITGAGPQLSPLWTPDGAYLLYYDPSKPALLAQRADGTGAATRIVDGIVSPWSFAERGRRLAYHAWSDETGFDLWTVTLEETPDGLRAGAPEPFLASDAFENYPAFSPDGRWLAHCSNESGGWEVYVRAFPSSDRRVRVSAGGGCISSWSHDGERLFYETLDRRIMAVHYRSEGDTFVPDAPEPFSATELADTGVLANFDVAPDGRAVVGLVPVGADPPRDHVTLVLGFLDRLRAR